MHFEVFHTGLLGRPNVIAVDMIQYPGLWGICFSHHAPNNNHPRYAADTSTAGVLRFLEAAADGRDGLEWEALAGYTVTTHHVDADAVLPVWALLHPEAALARRPLLERIARSGDFFLYLDEMSAKINAAIEGFHLRLRGQGKAGERLVDAPLSQACFDWLLPRMENLLDDPDSHRDLWEPALRSLHADRAYLAAPGRVTECWDRRLSLVETDHDPDPHALNTVCRNDLLLLWRTDKPVRRLEARPAIAWYELTSIPHQPCYDLADLAARLNRAEGISRAIPSQENAAGSSAAGLKSPVHDCSATSVWTYRPGPVSLDAAESRLCQNEVLEIVADWLGSHSEEQIPAAYRADVQEVYRFREYHATFDSHIRFAESPEVAFRPGAPYGGIHLLEAKDTRREGGLLHVHGGKHPIPFTVADDFYWNSAKAALLQLDVTYLDSSEGVFAVQYDAWGDPVCATPPVVLCGDRKLKTARFALCGPRLGASQEQGADLRLFLSPSTPLAIQSLVLHKGEAQC